jgi:hypothetical protein
MPTLLPLRQSHEYLLEVTEDVIASRRTVRVVLIYVSGSVCEHRITVSGVPKDALTNGKSQSKTGDVVDLTVNQQGLILGYEETSTPTEFPFTWRCEQGSKDPTIDCVLSTQALAMTETLESIRVTLQYLGDVDQLTLGNNDDMSLIHNQELNKISWIISKQMGRRENVLRISQKRPVTNMYVTIECELPRTSVNVQSWQVLDGDNQMKQWVKYRSTYRYQTHHEFVNLNR